MQGQQGKSGTTAYEVQLLQKQAQKVLSLIVFASSMLEKKLGYLRLGMVLWKYFDPIDTAVDDAKNEIKNVYRKTTRRVPIDGRGSGIRMIVPTDKTLPTSDQVFQQEEYMGTPAPQDGHRPRTREELGMDPYEIIYLSVEELRNTKWIFYIEVDAREKDTSSQAKLMFREELNDIMAMMKMGSQPNVEELQNTYALIWHRKKEKMFKAPQQVAPDQLPNGGANTVPNNPPIPMQAGA